MTSNDDPLNLKGLDPSSISRGIEAKSKAKVKQPSELELKKEERLNLKEQRLTSKGKPSDTSAPSETQAPIDPAQLLDKISAYKDRFPYLKSRNKVGAKSSIEEILDELHFIELQLGSNKDSSLGRQMFVASMWGIEIVSRDVFNPLNLNLTGLGQIATTNIAQFEDVIDELSIKYGASFYVQPEWRLIVAVGAMVVTVNAANKGDNRIADTLKKMNAKVSEPPGSSSL